MASLINMSGGSLLNKGLPYDAEIEYLETYYLAKNQEMYINTGISCSNDISLYADITPLDKKGNSLIEVNGYNFRLFNYQGTVYWDNPFVRNIDSRIMGGSWKSNERAIIEAGHGYIYKNNVLIGAKSVPDVTSSANIKICFLSYNSNKSRTHKIKLYNNSTLVRDFIPVRKDGVGYMYDKVSGQLFGNAGTGAFILGPDKTN